MLAFCFEEQVKTILNHKERKAILTLFSCLHAYILRKLKYGLCFKHTSYFNKELDSNQIVESAFSWKLLVVVLIPLNRSI